MSTLPLFYYPTTIAWVDDDELVLQVANELLGNENNVQTFSSPTACLDFFKNYVPHLANTSFLQGRTDDNETINHLLVDINTEALMQLPTQHARKNEISVLIVDFRMPEMTGIELCRKLKNINVKKILLTGEADHSLAVRAFNEGIIDCFLQKGSETLADDIKEYLSTLSKEYFFDRSKPLLTHLEIDRKFPLSDPVFISFFKNWCIENNIQEYYLLDKQGDMQVIDIHGKKANFIIHTDKTLDEFYEIYQDNKDTSNLVEAVKERKSIPFFGAGLEGWQFPPGEWPKHFYAPNVIEGREKYYWLTEAQ